MLDDGRKVLAWLGAVLGTLALAVLAISLLYSPEAIASGQHLVDLGLPLQHCAGCPLCGLSRGFALAGRGELAAAMALNPAVLVAWSGFWLTGLAGPAYFAFTFFVRRIR